MDKILPALSAEFSADPHEIGHSVTPADAQGVMMEFQSGLLGIATNGRMHAVRLSPDQMLALAGAMTARAVLDGADPARAATLIARPVAAEIERLTGAILPRSAPSPMVAGHA